MRYSILAALLALSACAPKVDEPRRAIVTTTSGPVIGVVGAGSFRFDNLPYGPSVKPWATPRDASTPGPVCVDHATDTDPCLNLTLIAPMGQVKAPVDISLDPRAKPTTGRILIIGHVRPDHPEDEQAVRAWVNANATAFSGNPDQVSTFRATRP